MSTAKPWVYGIKIGLTADATWTVYQEAWMDDREITIEDANEMATYGLKLGLIWGPELAVIGMLSAAPLWGVYAIIGVGFVASYAIGGRSGAEQFTEYIFAGPEHWLPTIRDQITDPIITELERVYQEQLVEPISEWWQYQIVDPITGSKIWNL